MNYSLGPVKWGDVTAFIVTVTMAWAHSWCVWVNPNVRHPWALLSRCGPGLSPSSAGILPTWSPVNGSPDSCLYVLTLWISDYLLKDPGAACGCQMGGLVGVPAAIMSLCSAAWYHSRPQSCWWLHGLCTLVGTVAQQLPLGSEACLFVKNKICWSVTLFESIRQSSK